MIYFWVGIAGAVGAILRYLIGVSIFINSTFPYATLVINLIGSFLLAWLTTNVLIKFSVSPVMVTAIGTGLVGSFTTFSTLSVETVALFQSGKITLALAYVFFSIVGGLAMSRLGFKVSQEVQRS